MPRRSSALRRRLSRKAVKRTEHLIAGATCSGKGTTRRTRFRWKLRQSALSSQTRKAPHVSSLSKSASCESRCALFAGAPRVTAQDVRQGAMKEVESASACVNPAIHRLLTFKSIAAHRIRMARHWRR